MRAFRRSAVNLLQLRVINFRSENLVNSVQISERVAQDVFYLRNAIAPYPIAYFSGMGGVRLEVSTTSAET